MIFGLLGKTLTHSFSPQIHRILGDYDYHLFEVEPDCLSDFFHNKSFDGINVTIPYKKSVIPFCDEISNKAKRIGSINTIIKKPDGSLYGDNTDYFGLKYLLTSQNINVTDKKVLILGSGGSSLTVKTILEDFQASKIITVSRTGEVNYDNIYNHSDTDIIINTTPVGMYPDFDKELINLSEFKACSYVIDLIYNPFRTNLLISAKKLGIPYSNGMSMLAAQAFRSAELFLDKTLYISKIETIIKKINNLETNIVLIGMPGCGKSLTAKFLGKETGCNVIDTDDIIEKSTSMSISEIFSKQDEKAFRKIESKVVSDINQIKSSIISVGGGAVLSSENRNVLMRNGVIIYLQRQPENLSFNGRPLSTDLNQVLKMADIRTPIYNSMADISISVIENDINATINNIMSKIYNYFN